MSLQSHPQWSLIEEVGLKKLYMDTMNKKMAPNCLPYIRSTLSPVIDNFEGSYYFLVKERAIKCLISYSNLLDCGESPKGRNLLSYGLPPAVRRLFLALHKGKV